MLPIKECAVYKEIIAKLLEEIATASEGRKVDLMAVSKTHPITTILEAVKGGQLLFGRIGCKRLRRSSPPTAAVILST